MLRRVGQAGYWLALAFIIAVAVLTAMSVLGVPKQMRVFVVQSGSMSPVIKTHSLVFVQQKQDYGEGDVITFLPPEANNIEQTVTHRIFSTEEADGVAGYSTKGDANETPDAWWVPRDSVLGKVVVDIPFLGYPVAFAKTQKGFILLIVVPATLIVYSEAINIKREIKKRLKTKAKDKKNGDDGVLKSETKGAKI